MTEIRIRTAKNGTQRATFYCRLARRWLPVTMSKALAMLANGTAVESKSLREIFAERAA